MSFSSSCKSSVWQSTFNVEYKLLNEFDTKKKNWMDKIIWGKPDKVLSHTKIPTHILDLSVVILFFIAIVEARAKPVQSYCRGEMTENLNI